MQGEINPKTAKSENTLRKQVASDLAAFIKHSKNPRQFLKKLSIKMDVHGKTLERVLSEQNRPAYATVFKIYRYILNETDDMKVIEKAPQVVKDYLRNASVHTFEKGVQYLSSIDKEIQKNPIFAEIYVLAGTGPLKETDIVSRYGSFGMQLVESMVQRSILSERKPGEFVLGSNQTNISPESILALGLQFSQNYARPEKSYERSFNCIGFLAEGLSEEAYIRWLEIDEAAYQQKLKIMRDPKSLGTKRAFAFNVTESIDLKEKK